MLFYVPVELGFRNHPKTIRFTQILNHPFADVFLVRLWEWCMVYAQDGDISHYTPHEIAQAVGYDGDADDLITAMHESGYLDDGVIHNWLERGRAGYVFSERGKAATRQQRKRDRDSMSRGRNATSRAVTSCHGASQKITKKRREEKSKEEKRQTLLRKPDGSRVRKNGGYPDDFERFWLAYPKKRNKGDALKAWKKLKPSVAMVDLLVEAVDEQKSWPEWCKERGQFIPYPASWLRAGGWDDEPTQRTGTTTSMEQIEKEAKIYG
jgi:hypothetical protein